MAFRTAAAVAVERRTLPSTIAESSAAALSVISSPSAPSASPCAGGRHVRYRNAGGQSASRIGLDADRVGAGRARAASAPPPPPVIDLREPNGGSSGDDITSSNCYLWSRHPPHTHPSAQTHGQARHPPPPHRRWVPGRRGEVPPGAGQPIASSARPRRIPLPPLPLRAFPRSPRWRGNWVRPRLLPACRSRAGSPPSPAPSGGRLARASLLASAGLGRAGRLVASSPRWSG